ncbi:uncharacterized protein BDR25DRAFT_361937 [Lindgomyces ingoldianus]|uniref:Uncharacterized protein n=1 Tax=Lindgomyces ingoldianus TaxID=673940 RepID=A0ACB6QBA4_9PLEO|nr:uncharacterized protein BDR25DRAFT_361937 [Lindgomyces ingoldianus]KAF2464191.1 hypothetical protein BDR25DRAFT_361937 [Lindgomyces ingoldianus]
MYCTIHSLGIAPISPYNTLIPPCLDLAPLSSRLPYVPSSAHARLEAPPSKSSIPQPQPSTLSPPPQSETLLFWVTLQNKIGVQKRQSKPQGTDPTWESAGIWDIGNLHHFSNISSCLFTDKVLVFGMTKPADENEIHDATLSVAQWPTAGSQPLGVGLKGTAIAILVNETYIFVFIVTRDHRLKFVYGSIDPKTKSLAWSALLNASPDQPPSNRPAPRVHPHTKISASVISATEIKVAAFSREGVACVFNIQFIQGAHQWSVISCDQFPVNVSKVDKKNPLPSGTGAAKGWMPNVYGDLALAQEGQETFLYCSGSKPDEKAVLMRRIRFKDDPCFVPYLIRKNWLAHATSSPSYHAIFNTHSGSLMNWRAAGLGVLRKTLESQTYYVIAVAFSPDGKTLASAAENHTVKLHMILVAPSTHLLSPGNGTFIDTNRGPLAISSSFNDTAYYLSRINGCVVKPISFFDSLLSIEFDVLAIRPPTSSSHSPPLREDRVMHGLAPCGAMRGKPDATGMGPSMYIVSPPQHDALRADFSDSKAASILPILVEREVVEVLTASRRTVHYARPWKVSAASGLPCAAVVLGVAEVANTVVSEFGFRTVSGLPEMNDGFGYDENIAGTGVKELAKSRKIISHPYKLIVAQIQTLFMLLREEIRHSIMTLARVRSNPEKALYELYAAHLDLLMFQKVFLARRAFEDQVEDDRVVYTVSLTLKVYSF